MPIEIKCTNCGRKCLKSPCYVKRSLWNFCSNSCKHEYMKGEKHPSWNGGKFLDKFGYVLIRPSLGKPKHEHRLVAETMVGRSLTKYEHVHHKNGIKTDNRPENLEILSHSDHSALHAREWQKKWAKNHDHCVTCGTNKLKHSGYGMCRNCYQRAYNARATTA